MTPYISVVMPTYNRLSSLRMTLEALARQTYLPELWEAVVVSDGSTDGTEAMLTEYAEKRPFNLRWMTQSNAGPSRARNRGIEESQGEVVVFLDDDVEPPPSFLASHAEHHKSDECVAVIGPLLPDPTRRDQEPAWIGWEHAMLEKQYTAFQTGEWATAGPHHFYSGNASVRKEHLVRVGSFDESFTRQEDVELATRLQRDCGVHFVFDPKARGIHRPQRSWTSWLNVPYAYGRLDVIRANRGDASWDLVRHGYFARNRATRLCARTVIALPVLGASFRALLRVGAIATYQLHLSHVAYSALSVVYNVHYLEGAQAELGETSLFRSVLQQRSEP